MDISETIGVQPEPAEYVVVLDTSGSMTKDGAWPQAMEAIVGLGGSLGPGDRLSVVTFDEFTDVAWQGEYPIDTQALVEALPAVPEGERTDIGAGLESAIGVLEGSDARALAAVVLMTDGEITTEPDSPYRTMSSPAWTTLARRAAALTGDTAAFALGLAQVTDAAAMRTVFPEAELMDEVELVDYLSGLSHELLLHRIEGTLAPDAGAELAVSWQDDAVTITSPLTYVPVQVTDLALSTDAGSVTLAEPLLLAPGKSATLRFTLAPGFSGRATLQGTVASPWQATLAQVQVALPTLADTPLVVAEQETGVSPSPAEAVQAQPVPEERQSDVAGVVSSVALLPLVEGLGVLVGAGALLAFVARPHRLRGSLTLEGGGHRHEIALTGRRMRLPENPLGLRGSVQGRRGVKGLHASVAASDGSRVRQRLADGDGIGVGSSTLTWQDERSVLEERLGLSPTR